MAMDQTISFSGAAFDNATIEYYASSEGVAKTFDHIVFNTVPGPGGLACMAIVAIAARRRRRR
jgi:MYXO-CTERM domain-containing protein